MPVPVGHDAECVWPIIHASSWASRSPHRARCRAVRASLESSAFDSRCGVFSQSQSLNAACGERDEQSSWTSHFWRQTRLREPDYSNTRAALPSRVFDLHLALHWSSSWQCPDNASSGRRSRPMSTAVDLSPALASLGHRQKDLGGTNSTVPRDKQRRVGDSSQNLSRHYHLGSDVGRDCADRVDAASSKESRYKNPPILSRLLCLKSSPSLNLSSTELSLLHDLVLTFFHSQ